MEGADETEPRRRRFRRRNIFYGALLLFVVLLGYAWFQRTQIADNFIRDELSRRDVRAQYTVRTIGLKTQRIENVLLGDPARPDLTARWVEIDVVPDGFGAKVIRVRAAGVRLYGTLTRRGLSFGEVDKFRDPASTAPFSLPEIETSLADARIRLATPYGNVGIRLDGQGALKNGFRGQAAAITDGLRAGSCAGEPARFYGTIAIDKGRPHLAGSLRNGALACSGFQLAAINQQLDVTLSDNLKSWTGSTRFAAQAARAAGYRLGAVEGVVDFFGNARRNDLKLEATAARLTGPDVALRRAAFAGDVQLRQTDGGLRAVVTGDPALQGLQLSASLVDPLDAAARGLGATPLKTVMERIAAAGRQALRSSDVSATLEAVIGGGVDEHVTLTDVRAQAASGARARLVDALRIARTKDGWSPRLSGTIRLAGGGLPDATLDLRPVGGGFAGRLSLADYTAGSSRFALPDLRFAPVRGGTSLSGRAVMTGPLFGGYVSGLRLPVQGTYLTGGGLTLWNSCQQIAFDAFRLSSLTLAPDAVRVCPTAGSLLRVGASGARANARVIGPDLAGRLGQTPITIAANGVDVTLAGFAAEALKVRLGTPDSRTIFDADRFAGRFGGAAGLSGTMAGGSGRIGNVPLLLREAAGDWRLRDGAFDLAGGLRIADAELVNRFEPMIGRDVMLRFAGNRITATGVLAEPVTGRKVADMDILHDLSTASGRADLTVRDLAFDGTLTPDMLTRLALGVVANVDGIVSGEGHIRWTGDRVSSTGEFTTDGIDLAAPFGPVEKLAGTIRFDDLLGLQTQPGQRITLGSVNPGLEVLDGALTYRLLAGQRVLIEGADWPFAGGTLHLDRTILDMAGGNAKKLTFAVRGMDIAVFLQRFGFDNLQATGVFDGTLPMTFDQSGGRIEGGRLVAREGGGTIAYVGELTYKDLSYFANLAFDMLKSIRYRDLTIALDGDLGGEMVTQVKFSGLQQGEGAKRNFITREIAKLPIQFNVNIKGPFLQLISSIKSYYDPSLLIKQNLPALIQQQRDLGEIRDRLDAQSRPAMPASPAAPTPITPVTPPPSVQPSESENMP